MIKKIAQFIYLHHKILLGIIGWLLILTIYPQGWQPPMYAGY
jgi:hypothetical protein